MEPFDFNLLTVPAAVIFIVTFLVCFRVLGSNFFSFFCALAKALIFFFYYGMVFDGTFSFFDDWLYLKGGMDLLSQDVGVFNLHENWDLAKSIGGGDHFLYYLYNAYAFRMFGEGYFAPVALNIMLTLAVAFYGTKLGVVEFKIPHPSHKLLFVFLLFHPDILAWSNVMNGKDILVLLLHVLLLLGVSSLLRFRFFSALMILLPVTFCLFYLRFYVPLLFAFALTASMVIAARGVRGALLFVASCTLAFLAYSWIGREGIGDATTLVEEKQVNFFYGFIRFALTPVPFRTEEAYSFLDFPALLHWLMFPCACIGFSRIWRLRTPFSRFFIMYVIIFSSLYAVFGELQGPRHRVQLDYAWAMLQFMGLMIFARPRVVSNSRELLHASHYSPGLPR